MARQWVDEPSQTQTATDSKSCQIRVLTWNVLAQQLTGIAKGDSIAFDRVNPAVLTWDHRKELLCQEFFKKDANDEPFWDVICLQEVDKHKELFMYETDFAGSCVDKKDKWTDGIWYNTKKLREVEAWESSFTDP